MLADARFREAFPAIELLVESATRTEGLRRLAGGEGELHVGAIDADEALPAFLRRERFIELTAGGVAWRGHPLLEGRARPGDLARYPWIDFDWPPSARLREPAPAAETGPVRRPWPKPRFMFIRWDGGASCRRAKIRFCSACYGSAQDPNPYPVFMQEGAKFNCWARLVLRVLVSGF